jgi:hypothetical protein
MIVISSRSTFLFKRIFPILSLAIPLIFCPYIGLIVASRPPNAFPIVSCLVLPLLLAAFGYWGMKKSVFNVADEVLDAGNALVVRRGGQEERIAFSDIKNVSYKPQTRSWPANVTLSMERPTAFGDSISFLAPTDSTACGGHTIVADLTGRADAARPKP